MTNSVEQKAGDSGDWVLVPRELTEHMRQTLHNRVMIRCFVDKRETSILNDQEWWAAILSASPYGAVPSTADIAAHGEAVMQRILTAEAERDTARKLLEAYEEQFEETLGLIEFIGERRDAFKREVEDLRDRVSALEEVSNPSLTQPTTQALPENP